MIYWDTRTYGWLYGSMGGVRSWSYPAKGNLITARQYFKDLKANKDEEAIEAGDNILREKGMMRIPQ